MRTGQRPQLSAAAGPPSRAASLSSHGSWVTPSYGAAPVSIAVRDPVAGRHRQGAPRRRGSRTAPGARRTRPRRRPTTRPVEPRTTSRSRSTARTTCCRPRPAAWSCRRRSAPARRGRGTSPASRVLVGARAPGTSPTWSSGRCTASPGPGHRGPGRDADPVAVLVRAEVGRRRTPSAAARPTWSSRSGRRSPGRGVTRHVLTSRRTVGLRRAAPASSVLWRRRPGSASRPAWRRWCSAWASRPTSTRALSLRTPFTMISRGRARASSWPASRRTARRSASLSSAGETRGVAGDRGLDAAGVHGGDADRVAGDEHLLAQRLGHAADGVLGGVVRSTGRASRPARTARRC